MRLTEYWMKINLAIVVSFLVIMIAWNQLTPCQFCLAGLH